MTCTPGGFYDMKLLGHVARNTESLWRDHKSTSSEKDEMRLALGWKVQGTDAHRAKSCNNPGGRCETLQTSLNSVSEYHHPELTPPSQATVYESGYRPRCSRPRWLHNLIPVPPMGSKRRQQRVLNGKITGRICELTPNNWNKKRGPRPSRLDHLGTICEIEATTRLSTTCYEGQPNLARGLLASYASGQRINIPFQYIKNTMFLHPCSRIHDEILNITFPCFFAWHQRVAKALFQCYPLRKTTQTEGRHQAKRSDNNRDHDHSRATISSLWCPLHHH